MGGYVVPCMYVCILYELLDTTKSLIDIINLS